MSIFGIVVESERDAGVYSALVPRIRSDVTQVLRMPCGDVVQVRRRFVGWLKHFEWHSEYQVDKAFVIRDSDRGDPEDAEAEQLVSSKDTDFGQLSPSTFMPPNAWWRPCSLRTKAPSVRWPGSGAKIDRCNRSTSRWKNSQTPRPGSDACYPKHCSRTTQRYMKRSRPLRISVESGSGARISRSSTSAFTPASTNAVVVPLSTCLAPPLRPYADQCRGEKRDQGAGGPNVT